ncbi:MAG: helix-turn-helix domain-containing protein [Pseudomonadota bacterium]
MTIDPDAFIAACPSRRLLARIGEKWTLMIVVALEADTMRFGALRNRLEGVSQKMLTQSLRALERDGLVGRQVFNEMPLRVEYALTPLGRCFLPHAIALKAWAEANLKDVESAQSAFDAKAADTA